MAIVLAVVIGIFLVGIALVVIISMVESEPSINPIDPPQKLLKKSELRARLLHPPDKNTVKLAINKQTQPVYNRPLDVAPDDQLLPPPRDVDGINGE